MQTQTFPRRVVLQITLSAALAASCGGGLPDKYTSGGANITVCPRGPTVQGIDVSEWQGGVDWAAVAGSGKDFAYARVSDGFHRDPTFASNWAGMKNAGLIRGVYQYFEPNLDPNAQADIVIEAVGGSLGAGDLPPMLDIEYADAGTSAARILWAMKTWADKIEHVLGKKPVIYTGGWWWNPWTNDSGQFSTYPLADSWYNNACPNIAAGWGDWAIWQYSSTGRVPGISGNVDLEKFNGTLDELRAFAGGGATPGGPCVGRYGDWCGGSLGLDGNTLYRCVSGEAQVIEACAWGCHVNPPGVNDACNAAPPPPPSGPCAGRYGDWCGSSLGLDGDTLYRCVSGEAQVLEVCASGCQINPPGVNDACSAPPPSAGPCSGRRAGYWCGSELGLDNDTLYTCDGSSADESVAETCDQGCKVNPPGVNDECFSASCSDLADGAYCGSDQVGGNPALLYSCVDGSVDSFAACSGRCVTMPAGTNDFCR